MANLNVLKTDAAVDFAVWEAELATPYGQEMLVGASEELTDPVRTLACANPGDYAIMDLAPESIDLLEHL
ncbi:MAG TPA: hypothetical protein VLA92_00070 [Candidatus Saccharimonadales bacterium]|nr:hypothetical protein [Candidatus Saccharimonadales bacterium]